MDIPSECIFNSLIWNTQLNQVAAIQSIFINLFFCCCMEPWSFQCLVIPISKNHCRIIIAVQTLQTVYIQSPLCASASTVVYLKLSSHPHPFLNFTGKCWASHKPLSSNHISASVSLSYFHWSILYYQSTGQTISHPSAYWISWFGINNCNKLW